MYHPIRIRTKIKASTKRLRKSQPINYQNTTRYLLTIETNTCKLFLEKKVGKYDTYED